MPMLAAQAVASQRVDVAFDSEVAVSDGSAFSLRPLDVPAVTPMVVGMAPDGTLLRLSLDIEMTPDVRYELRAFGVPPHDGQIRFVGYRPTRPATRKFELWRMMPEHNRRDDQTGDLRRFIACLQEVLDLLLSDVDRWPEIFDFERAPEPFVDAILADLGNPFHFELDASAKRRLAAVLVEMYRQRGTEPGIRNAVRFFVGLDIAVTEFAAETLVLGEAELGIDWILGPSAQFALYAFDVAVSRVLTDVERRQLRSIVEALKPGHTHFVTLLEPLPVEELVDWVLGLSELGVSTALW